MSSQHLQIPGGLGNTLAARLELPDGPVRAFGVHAHCFTCSKDGLAAFHLGKALASAGIAMLRFDFTGIGDSHGDFAATTFSSRIADVVAAADWLRTQHGPPQLLVGHSLGGATTIAAAGRIPDARAIVTIGAPFDPATVIRQFGDRVEDIRRDGEAEVRLAGRSFRIGRGLLDDLAAQHQAERIRELRRPLLVLHSPLDDTVPIEEAGRIFQTALHPKSFVSLDRADHLLSRTADARWVAGMIAAWAAPYLGEPAPSAPA